MFNLPEGIKRKMYYSPVIDPEFSDLEWPESHELYFEITNVNVERYPNLVSSLCVDGLHRPALDVDIPIDTFKRKGLSELASLMGERDPEVIASYNGNCHVYGAKPYTIEAYLQLMFETSLAGFVSSSYLRHSMKSGQSFLRIPGYEKIGGAS